MCCDPEQHRFHANHWERHKDRIDSHTDWTRALAGSKVSTSYLYGESGMAVKEY
jgi:hypothetical protein